ncbi:MAG TPA: hypothetical protein PK352_12090 [Tenuifilaceae bacterium]|nr:MAG: hypothetical protein BWX63_02387 [Bacteroidetes bacterium ADurb.Bin041]HQI60477.1 hypothetical protein [Tenuifilaceae bacterium]
MKLHLFLILIILVSIAGTCDYNDNRLNIKNNSNHAIAFDYSIDTTLEKRANDNIQFYIREKILPGETKSKSKPGSTQGWPFLIQRSNNKKLNVFIINIDTLLKYNDWEYIRNHRLYKRYSFTEEELKRINWIIEYP